MATKSNKWSAHVNETSDAMDVDPTAKRTLERYRLMRWHILRQRKIVSLFHTIKLVGMSRSRDGYCIPIRVSIYSRSQK
jgi:hypothetical protein